MKDKQIEISIGRRFTRLLCLDCNELSQVKNYSNETLMASLKCGCVRTLELLPSAAGAVSLENILANDELAQRWFPFTYEDKRGTDYQIAEEQMRQQWAA